MKNNVAILEIRPGPGGEEAKIWAQDLLRMYARFANSKGWKVIQIDEGVIKISGEGTFSTLQNEAGVHRVQRIPKTEKSGRIHTSTASIAIIPEIEEREIQINPGDLEISFFRSSGPGGQNVNKVETAVRIIHKPSGVVVASQAGRSQHANREQAMNILRAKIYEAQRIEEQAKLGAFRREQIGTADRSEKIRTYNFPDDRITDHRIGKKFHNIEKVLNGELEPIINAFKKS